MASVAWPRPCAPTAGGPPTAAEPGAPGSGSQASGPSASPSSRDTRTQWRDRGGSIACCRSSEPNARDAAPRASGGPTWRITPGSVYSRQYRSSSEGASGRRRRHGVYRSPATSALRVDRAPQVGPCARVEALVEEVAQVNPGFAQQGLEETATVEPEQPRRDGAAVLGGDAAIVGVEHGRLRAEDRHVAVEEVTGVVGDGAITEIAGRELPVARGEFDQFGHARRIDGSLGQPLRDFGDGEFRRARFVVSAAGFVDRVVVEHREEGFRRLRPARPGGHFGVVAQDFAHVVEVVVRPRRFGVGGLQRGELLFGKLDWRDRGHGSGGWEALPTILRRPSMGECFPCNQHRIRLRHSNEAALQPAGVAWHALYADSHMRRAW